MGSDSRRTSISEEDWDAYDAMLQHIYTQVQSSDNQCLNPDDPITTGVCLRTDTGVFRLCPPDEPTLQEFKHAVIGLKAVVAVKLHNASVSAALSMIGPNEFSMFVGADTRVQILETMADLPLADKEQCAAFIRDEHVLVLWAEQVSDILPLCTDFESLLLQLVITQWRSKATAGWFSPSASQGSPSSPSTRIQSQIVSRVESQNVSYEGSQVNLAPGEASASSGSGDNSDPSSPEQPQISAAPPEAPAPIEATPPHDEKKSEKKKGWFSRSKTVSNNSSEVDLEKGKMQKPRKTQLFAPVYGGIATALTIFFIGNGVNTLFQEFLLDGSFIRFSLLITAPFVFCVALFFSCQFVSNIFFCIGPVKQYHENSKYYSAIAPAVDPNDLHPDLPHVTIQMPVYTEGLRTVIQPSVESLKKAMLTYARQGGTCSLIVCDDGMQTLSEEDRMARMEFYENHGIGWVSRPKHNSKPGGYRRAGRFKKASNMNFGLALSMSMERHILALHAEDPGYPDVEEKALALAIEEKNAELDETFVKPFREKAEKEGDDVENKTVVPKVEAWAKNAKALRIGAVILIVDSDTQVPQDCLRDAAMELRESPQVAIIQHESDVMQVAHHWFENGIAHFTRRINTCISMGCANGEVAPFVGHNAFLRWQAIQDAAFIDPDDGIKKIWSESNVSEDFDMALRLQLKGYIIRWATYSNGGFKEGVSLTVDDELNRWQKYAYGCSELMFQPFKLWFKRGPLQSRLRSFVWSTVPLHSKLTTLSYIFSYYGIAGAVMLSIINYVIVGLTFQVDQFYVHSWEVWLSCTVVFIGMGNVAFTLLEYRLHKSSLLHATWTTVKWIPFFFFFFGGLSYPLTTALLSHLFSYNITWSTTVKEVELSNFFVEVPRILKLFWRCFLMSFILVVVIVLMASPLVPVEWQVTDYAVVFPLALTAVSHILYPIVLNPWLMIFSY